MKTLAALLFILALPFSFSPAFADIVPSSKTLLSKGSFSSVTIRMPFTIPARTRIVCFEKGQPVLCSAAPSDQFCRLSFANESAHDRRVDEKFLPKSVDATLLPKTNRPIIHGWISFELKGKSLAELDCLKLVEDDADGPTLGFFKEHFGKYVTLDLVDPDPIEPYQ